MSALLLNKSSALSKVAAQVRAPFPLLSSRERLYPKQI